VLEKHQLLVRPVPHRGSGGYAQIWIGSAANSVMGQGVAMGEFGNSLKSEIVRGSSRWLRDAYFVNRNESNDGREV
jgi:hypothetical protein